MGNPEMTTTIATRHRCQPVNATTWRVEFCNGKRWELVALIERAEVGSECFEPTKGETDD